MAGGFLAILGKAKPSADSDSDMPGKGMMGSGGGGPERDYAREAFSAIKDDDEEGFISAFISAVKACSRKSGAGEYEPDADDEA